MKPNCHKCQTSEHVINRRSKYTIKNGIEIRTQYYECKKCGNGFSEFESKKKVYPNGDKVLANVLYRNYWDRGNEYDILEFEPFVEKPTNRSRNKFVGISLNAMQIARIIQVNKALVNQWIENFIPKDIKGTEQELLEHIETKKYKKFILKLLGYGGEKPTLDFAEYILISKRNAQRKDSDADFDDLPYLLAEKKAKEQAEKDLAKANKPKKPNNFNRYAPKHDRKT